MSKREYTRPQATELGRRLEEPRRFVQVITGARQVGKTTLVMQVAAGRGGEGLRPVLLARPQSRGGLVTRVGGSLTAIEVKSGRSPDALPGMAAFADAFRPTRKLLVGGDGIAVEEFLSRPVGNWVE